MKTVGGVPISQPLQLFGDCIIDLPDGQRITIVQDEHGRYMVEIKRYRGLCDAHKKPATWVRRTQFFGDHFFCDECAVQEKDFGEGRAGYFFWDRV